MTTKTGIKYQPTRFKELGYYNWGRCWCFLDRETESQVGYTYQSRAELLADLDRYAKEFGCNP